jgi:hypothetical protein
VYLSKENCCLGNKGWKGAARGTNNPTLATNGYSNSASAEIPSNRDQNYRGPELGVLQLVDLMALESHAGLDLTLGPGT